MPEGEWFCSQCESGERTLPTRIAVSESDDEADEELEPASKKRPAPNGAAKGKGPIVLSRPH